MSVAFDPSEEQQSSSRSRATSNAASREHLTPNKSSSSNASSWLDRPPAPPSRSPERLSPRIHHQDKGHEWPQENIESTKDVSGKNEQATCSTGSKDAETSRIPIVWGGDSYLPSIDSSPLFPSSNGDYTSPEKESFESRLLTGSGSAYSEQQSPALNLDTSALSSHHPLGDESPGEHNVNENATARTRDNSLKTLQQSTPSERRRSISPTPVSEAQKPSSSAADDNARTIASNNVSDDSSGGLDSEAFMQRMSNSVKHARSLSDKAPRDHRLQRVPVNGSQVLSPRSEADRLREEVVWLRGELGKERQRVKERDQRVAAIETALNASADIKRANNELDEKRSTMVVLDAQREIILRELGVLSDHAGSESRDSISSGLDLQRFTDPILREFANSINRLEQSYAPQIEELVRKRNDASEELANVNRLKDRSLREFEQLSSKNAQLAELNNELVHQIQELYKANSTAAAAASAGGGGSSAGLGIYSHSKEKSTDAIKPFMGDFGPSGSPGHVQEDMEPQVVSLRKGQPRKFNWKKGGQKARGVTRGIKDAFMSSEPKDASVSSYSSSVTTLQDMNNPGLHRPQPVTDPSRQGFGFFGNQRSRQGIKAYPNGNGATDVLPNGRFFFLSLFFCSFCIL